MLEGTRSNRQNSNLTQRVLQLLVPAGQVVELRAPNATIRPGYRATKSGYFDSLTALESEAAGIDAPAVYVTLNQLAIALLARRKNRVIALGKDDAATSDKDIVSRRFLLLDIDAVRPSGICATDTEKAAAKELADQVHAYLTAEGWPEPIVIDSGNGFYLIYKIDLLADDGGLVKKLLAALATRHDTIAAKVDQSVHKPSQLLRLPGTMNRKGDNLSDRPHRQVVVLYCPDLLQIVSKDALEAITAKLPEKKIVTTTSSNEYQHRLDLPKYLAHFEVEQFGSKLLPDGRVAYRVRCPFDPSHAGTDANVMQDEISGSLSFQCFHSSCSGTGWQHFKQAVGQPLPQHYDPPLTTGPRVGFSGETLATRFEPKKPEWPAPIADDAYYGLAGESVRLLAPHTESDPIALLMQMLVMFGNVIGRNAHFMIEGTAHYAIIFNVLVGGSSSGRKGTSYGRVRTLFELLDDDWLRERNKGGISSAEGMLFQVRDANEKLEDEGEPDKRLMLTEPEFANVLKQCERQGNTVSVYLRQLWDGLHVVQTLTKNVPIKATDAHVSLNAHITPDELRRYMTATEQANGFANRHLFVCVRRSKFLPFGGKDLDPLAMLDLQRRLANAAGFAQTAGRIDWHSSARPLWEAVYPILAGERKGLAGEITARAAAITLRLAMLYALLDRSKLVRPRHLMAALSIWDFAERSVTYLFGDRTGNPLADEILELLQNAPAGMSRSDLVAAFGRHQYGDKLTAALNALLSAGLAVSKRRETGGKPSQIWFATTKTVSESSLIATAREVFSKFDRSTDADLCSTPDTPFQRFHSFHRNPTTAPDILFSPPSSPEPRPASPPTPCETFLVNALRNGPRLKTEIDNMIKAAGVSGVKSAAKKLGVIFTQLVVGQWTWELPEGFDFGPYPIPPEPQQPSLVDGIAPPPEQLAPKTGKAKRKRRKNSETKPNSKPPDERLTADQLEKLLRKAKRPWSEVAAYLHEIDEYHPAELEAHGLTERQLKLAIDWLITTAAPSL